MAAAPAKFTFDLDLGHVNERSEVLTESALQDKLQAARQEGYEAGFAAGENGAVARSSAALAAAAERLAQQAGQLAGAADAHNNLTRAEAVQLAATVGRKLARHLVERHPVAELEKLISECLASLERAPHLVIRCHPDLADPVREVAEARMLTSGFQGRLVVMGDPDIPEGDGRLEWVDGGLVREQAAIDADIENIISAWVAAQADESSAENVQ